MRETSSQPRIGDVIMEKNLPIRSEEREVIMKVVGICAGRKNGNTEFMMKEAFMAIEASCGAECLLMNLQDAKINTCIGCESCVTHHLRGDMKFRCVHKNGSDHIYFIENLLRTADAVIVSSPAYNLLPTGHIIKFLNKLHATGDYSQTVNDHPKIGAAFSIGGSDWTNFCLTFCKKIAMELIGTYETLVDAVNFDYIPSKAAVLLEEDIMDRMRLLGTRVGEALLLRDKGETPVYSGIPGICPDCHGNLLEIRADGAYCPQCMTKASLSLIDGKLTVDFTTEEIAKNRWSEWGDQQHKNRIRAGHQKAAEHKDLIAERSKKYIAYGSRVAWPKIRA